MIRVLIHSLSIVILMNNQSDLNRNIKFDLEFSIFETIQISFSSKFEFLIISDQFFYEKNCAK